MAIFSERLLLILIIAFLTHPVFCQNDSLLIELDRLGLSDIHITKEEVANNKVYTASKTLNNAEELPSAIYVVTGDEILQNGYFTLADVLRQVPGVFVSQPGSAIHGETFMMNGLYGNTHAKIMIDNIPIKPYNSSGTPIGQQLPIRQAERIEIIFGPSIIHNSTNAGAGTINIVTRKSDRPVYVHADLDLGTEMFNNINVLFGGKIGKNKNTLKFSAYGSSSIQEDINIPYYYPYFNPATYTSNSFYAVPDSIFSSGLLPQSSRQFSLDLKYRSFSFTVTQQERTIHSAVGSNPNAISYENDFTTFGERTSVINFNYEKDKKRVGFKFNIGYVSSVIDKESSFIFIEPIAKQLYDQAIDQKVGGDEDLRTEQIEQGDRTYFDNRRFATGYDSDISVEQNISIFPFPNVELVFGANFSFLLNTPYSEFNNFPQDNDIQFDTGTETQGNLNYFSKIFMNFEKFNVVLGLNNFRRFSSENIPTDLKGKLLPQLAGLYKINSSLSLRANYSTSFLLPSSYWIDKSLRIDTEATPIMLVSNNEPFGLNPQETKYTEIGLGWKINKKVSADISAFRTQNSNLMNYQITENLGSIEFGFNNLNGLDSDVKGLRFSIIAKNVIKKLELNLKTHWSYFGGNQDLQSGENLNSILGQPEYLGQLNASVRLFKKMYFMTDVSFVGPYAASDIKSIAEYEEHLISVERRRSSILVNLTATLKLTENFSIFAKGNNFSDTIVPGIDASGSPDDLSLNVQRDPYITAGLSYTLD